MSPTVLTPRTVKYGTETISYLTLKIWSILLQTIKENTYIYSVKTKLKTGKPIYEKITIFD